MYSTTVTSQWSLDNAMTKQSDNLIVSDPIEPTTSDTVLGNPGSIRKQPLSYTSLWIVPISAACG